MHPLGSRNDRDINAWSRLDLNQLTQGLTPIVSRLLRHTRQSAESVIDAVSECVEQLL